MIDAGPTRYAALKALKSAGISSLDMVALSHHHSDHYGGMEEVVKAMKPKYFVASRSGHATSMYLKLLKTVEAQHITMVQPSAKPRKIELGSVELTLFPQPPEDRKEENNNSIGLRMTYGSFAVLFTGDSEETERQWWLRNDPSLVRNCTILKLAHHGSRNGTDTRLAANRPPGAGGRQPGTKQRLRPPAPRDGQPFEANRDSAVAHRSTGIDHDHQRWSELAGDGAIIRASGPADAG